MTYYRRAEDKEILGRSGLRMLAILLLSVPVISVLAVFLWCIKEIYKLY